MSEQIRSADCEPSCWSEIGVWGNGSCPKLEREIHCRNCPVFAAGGRLLLKKEGEADYLDEWADLLSRDRDSRSLGELSALLFRIGQVWFGLPTPICREVIEECVVHHLPHRSDAVCRGLVNVHGKIKLCISLEEFLDIVREGEVDGGTGRQTYRRMLMVEKKAQDWVFSVDEVQGIHHFHADSLLELPTTVAQTVASYTRGRLEWEGRYVSYLDDELLFSSLEERVL